MISEYLPGAGFNRIEVEMRQQDSLCYVTKWDPCWGFVKRSVHHDKRNYEALRDAYGDRSNSLYNGYLSNVALKVPVCSLIVDAY